MFDDYVFFNDRFVAEFRSFLTARGIPHQVEGEGDGEEMLVRVPDDLDEATCDAIEAEYDRLFAAQSDLTAEQEPDDINRVGIQFTPGDGVVRQARLHPQLVNRLHQVLSYEEIQSVVQAVADAVEDAGIKPLCKP
ncbi:MAG: hypothetical protein ACPGUC_05195 [Gammaproteobacteria bacterium]